MKSYLLVKILIIAGCSFFMIGCQATEEQEKPMFKFCDHQPIRMEFREQEFLLVKFIYEKNRQSKCGV